MSVELAHVFRSIAVGIVQEVTFQPREAPGDLQPIVWGGSTPLCASSPREANLTVRVPATSLEWHPIDVVTPCELGCARIPGCAQEGFDRRGEFWAQTLVGVQGEDPVSTCLLPSPLLLRDRVVKGPLQHPSPTRPCDCDGVVATATVYDDHLIDEGSGLDAPLQMLSGILRNDDQA